MVEPLPDLIRAIVRCARCAGESEATPPPSLVSLRTLMAGIVRRFSACSLPSLGLSEKCEMSQVRA